MQPNDITFFQRFQDDILARRKTITIRDESESHFKTGDVLRVGRFEDDGYFCTIEVTATSTVTLDLPECNFPIPPSPTPTCALPEATS